MAARDARATLTPWLCLALGSIAFTFVGWRFNVPLAAWIAPIFLLRFFRDARPGSATLAAIPLLAAASVVQLNGGWDLDAWMLPVFSLLRPAAFVAALYADRGLARRLPGAAATLVYPAVFLVVDWAICRTPLGGGFSASATQLGMPAVAALASITGSWGIGFLQGWTAAVLNTLWDGRAEGPARRRGIAVAWVLVIVVVFAWGSARTALARPSSPTVRVAGITVPHPRDYWNLIDAGTPREAVAAHAAEIAGIEEELFRQSGRAAAAGARIVFWSEGNAVMAEDHEAAFSARAAAFAKERGVYLGAAVLVLRYGSSLSDNKVLMFTPEGTLAFTYVKTMSWYPTGSDGILRTVDTPWGRLGAAICFDMDFPAFVHHLGAVKADIVLVPAYDTERIRPFHTEVGLLRGVENGFSVVRMTSHGTSMAMDGSGRVLARQEYFETEDRLMLADVPTKRLPTPYALLGEWFAWAGMALAASLLAWALRGRRFGGRGRG